MIHRIFDEVRLGGLGNSRRARRVGKVRAAAVITVVAITAMLTATPTVTATASVTALDSYDCTGWQHREFPTPGFNTDVWIKLCVEDTGSHRAWGKVKWQDGAGLKKFDNFDQKVRLERYDNTKDTHLRDFTREINSRAVDNLEYCRYAVHSSTRNRGWTADGVVYFNVDSDSYGGFKWKLHGTSNIG